MGSSDVYYSSLSDAAKKQAELDREKNNHDVLVESLAYLNQSSKEIKEELRAFIDSDIFERSEPTEIKQALSNIIDKQPEPRSKAARSSQSEETTKLPEENIVLDIDNPEDSIQYTIIPEPERPWDGIWNMDEVDSRPSYPGGFEAFSQFVSDNINYPEAARRMGIEGKVYVQFIILKSGLLINPTAIKGIGGGCDEEAVRAVDLSGRWKPAIKDGKPVVCRLIFPIPFKLI